MKNKCLIFGYQGLGNIGDDLMFKSIRYENRDIDIFSNKNTYSIDNEHKLSKKEFLKNIFIIDNFYISGGNVFSYERKRSILKVFILFLIFFIRKLLKKNTVIDSVGLNLKVNKLWRIYVCLTLKMTKDIYLRDSLSYRYYRMFFDRSVRFNFDRVYRSKNFISKLLSQSEKNTDAKYILWFVSEPAYRSKVKDVDLETIIENNLNYKIVFFCQQNSDVDRVQDIVNKHNIDYSIYNYSYDNLNQALEMINNSNFVITERYHGALLAEVFEKKWYKVDYSEKLNRVSPNKFCILN